MIEYVEQMIGGVAMFFVLGTVFFPLFGLMWSFMKHFINMVKPMRNFD